MKSRVVLHPLLANPKSRQIFFYFLALSLVIASFLGYEFHLITTKAGLDLRYGAPSENALLSILISWHFQAAVAVLASLVAAGLTAQFVTGPVKRIERWLEEWQAGKMLLPLRLRQNDKFFRLGELINQLRVKQPS